MRILALVLLSLTTLTARADDPPFLIAAKERQANAKAFVVKWSYVESIQGLEVFAPKRERIDAETTGRGELMSDGEKWWFKIDPDSSQFNLPSNRRDERSFNGTEARYVWGSLLRKGPRTGEWDYMYISAKNREPLPWPEVATPLRSLFRGADRESVLSSRTGYTPWEAVGGSLQPIGDRMCQEYQRRFRDRPAPERLWVDPTAGYLPIRYQDQSSNSLFVEYKPHPVLGWVPSGWSKTVGRPPSLQIQQTKVKIDSFELRDAIPDDRFTLKFPVGSRVSQTHENASGHVTETDLVVAEDGKLVPAPSPVASDPPRTELPSPSRTLWVVGGTLMVFIAFVVLVKRLSRSRTDDPERVDDERNPPR